MRFVIVIEVDPSSFRSAHINSVGPFREFFLRIMMPVPALGSVQSDIDIIGCFHEFVRESWSAARTEDYSSL